MLSKVERSDFGKPLDQIIIQKFEELLKTSFKENLEELKATFHVFGELYPDEICLGVTLETKDAATSIVISLDLISDNPQEALLETMLDACGSFFDSYFADSDWNDYSGNWSSETFKNLSLFIRVTRENLHLTLEAEKLLAQDN